MNVALRFLLILSVAILSVTDSFARGRSTSSSGSTDTVAARKSGQPAPGWARTYGGPDEDVPHSIRQTADGGYVVAGTTRSFGAGGMDAWIVKLKPNGDVEWQKAYGGSWNPHGGGDGDAANSIWQTVDGGFIVAGSTECFGWIIPAALVLRLRPDGSIMWQNYYAGDIGYNYAYSIQETADSGYIVAGQSFSTITNTSDAWVFKLFPNLSESGAIDWMKTYRGLGHDYATSIQQISGGGYIVAGVSDGAAWVFKLKPNGDIEWQKRYGGAGLGIANSIQQTADHGYIVAGVSNGAAWVAKLKPDGAVVWEKRYGGPGTGAGSGAANSIQQTSDGGYIVAGHAQFFGPASSQDAWVSKLNPLGFQVWQKRYAGNANDVPNSVQQTSDGGYITAGGTYSFGTGLSDFFVLKFDPNGGNCATVKALGAGISTSLSVTTPTPLFGNSANLDQAASSALITPTSATVRNQCP